MGTLPTSAQSNRCDIKVLYRTQQEGVLCGNTMEGGEQLGQDLFSLKNTHYLLAVDYFSRVSHCQKTAESPKFR